MRRAGIVRLRELELPSLVLAASPIGPAGPETRADLVERLLRLAVTRMGGGTLQEAAEYSLGLAPGTRDWPPSDRRRRAAGLYGVSIERFRKHHEVMVLGQVAEQVVRISAGIIPPDRARLRDSQGAVPAGHRTLRIPAYGRVAAVTLHVHPVDLLRDVDVIVSPTNTYLALPEAYKSSVSASLRRAGALRDLVGGLVEDSVHDELRGWTARHGAPGRAVLPGTVAATGSGALERQGVRRIYHAAVAVPRPGTNDYDIQLADVTRAAARALALLAEEHDRFDPALRSICFPLLGSGRGGLPHELSFGAVWAAIDAELARGAEWDVHLLVRRQKRADLVELLLTGCPVPAEDDSGEVS